MFENDVNMYGTQACQSTKQAQTVFENDVNMYGTQAYSYTFLYQYSLRMM